MLKRWHESYRNSDLATKIRYSYLVMVIPMVLFAVFCILGMRQGNRQYKDMVNSAVAASQFSLDFKADFDYEAYLLIVGNKSVYSSDMDALLEEATRIVDELEGLTVSKENLDRLESAKKYLSNLATYKSRIEDNIGKENMYEANIEIWENDIQIVTGLLEETMSEYIYYEIKDIQAARSEYEQVYQRVFVVGLFLFGVIAVITIILSYKIPQSITKPVTELSEVTNEIANGNLSVRSHVNAGAELGNLSDSLNTMIDKINELLAQVTEEQIRLRKAELELLQAQINPHFLYNTLDTIIWLAEGEDHKKVVSMVGSLSEFFRTSLNQGREVISLKEELMHVRSYLEIQQVRYQDILDYSIEVPEELNIYTIPKITIQPLVENALYHGIKYKRSLGKITITGEKKDDKVYLYVKDNGIGMTKERLDEVNHAIANKQPGENQIYGLYNVNERIALKFGSEYGISFESQYEQGTTVTIVLPCSFE